MGAPYDTYPSVDSDNNFAPPVRQAIANSAEIKTAIGAEVLGDTTTGRGVAKLTKDTIAPLLDGAIDVASRQSLTAGPMMFLGGRASNRVVTTGTPAIITPDDELVDTDNIRLAGDTQLSIKKSGLWEISGAIEWQANATGTRTVEILHNGVVKDRKGPAAPPASGSMVQSFGPLTINAAKDDFVQIRVTQTSGGDLSVLTGLTSICLRHIGVPVGPRGGLIFDSSHETRGLQYYLGRTATVLPERVFLEPDPAGYDRTVMKIHTREVDDVKIYPRVQLATPSNLEGTFYVGYGIYIPSWLDPEWRMMLHELHGPPFNEGGPNSIRFDRQGFCMSVNSPSVEPDEDIRYDSQIFYRWQPPRDKWIDIVQKWTLSTDPTVGGLELFINIGNGWVQQTFLDGSTFKHWDTLRPGVNSNSAGTTKQYSTIKVSYGNSAGYGNEEAVQIYFSGHKTGTSLAAVDPGTYGYVPSWKSTPTIGDTFYRSARTLDTQKLPDGENSSVWTDPQAASWQIAGNRARPGSVGGTHTHLLADMGKVDGWYEVTLTTWSPSGSAGDQSGLVVRSGTTGSSQVGVQAYSDGYRVRSISAGTGSTLGALIAKVPAAGDRIRAKVQGDQLTVQINNLTPVTVTMTANLTNTFAGLRRGAGSGTSAVAFSEFGYWDIDLDPGWGW